MNIIFLCSTYMQIINAVQIRLNLKKEYDADIVINDHSSNAKEIALGIEKTGIFNHVIYIENKCEMFAQSHWDDIRSLFELCFIKNNRCIKPFIDNGIIYDEIYFYNEDFVLYAVFDFCCSQGNFPKLFRFEEGITGYKHLADSLENKVQQGFRMKIYNKYRKFSGKKTINRCIDAYYVYFPQICKEFLPEQCRIEQLPMLSKYDEQTIHILNQIFSYNPKNDLFNEKYIFLASSLDIDGTNSNESDIILDIANQVGKENLLVKMHPRDTRDIYKKNGLKVSKNSYVPWEIILLNHNFSNNVFLSISSGSMLTGPAVMQENYTSYYLYPIVFEQLNERGKSAINGTKQVLKQIQQQGKCSKCYVCNTITQLNDILR